MEGERDAPSPSPSPDSHAQLLAELQSIVTCAVCWDLFTDPRSLKCGHTYCSACLAKIGEATHWRIQCPQCRAMVRTSGPEDLARFPVNTYVKNIIEAIHVQESARERRRRSASLDDTHSRSARPSSPPPVRRRFSNTQSEASGLGDLLGSSSSENELSLTPCRSESLPEAGALAASSPDDSPLHGPAAAPMGAASAAGTNAPQDEHGDAPSASRISGLELRLPLVDFAAALASRRTAPERTSSPEGSVETASASAPAPAPGGDDPDVGFWEPEEQLFASFVVPASDVSDLLRRWADALWFAPDTLFSRMRFRVELPRDGSELPRLREAPALSKPGKISPVWIPFWCFEVTTHTSIHASVCKREVPLPLRSNQRSAGGKKTAARRDAASVKFLWTRCSSEVQSSHRNLVVCAARLPQPQMEVVRQLSWDFDACESRVPGPCPRSRSHSLRDVPEDGQLLDEDSSAASPAPRVPVPNQADILDESRAWMRAQAELLQRDEQAASAKLLRENCGEQIRDVSCDVTVTSLSRRLLFVPAYVGSFSCDGVEQQFACAINAATGELAANRPYGIGAAGKAARKALGGGIVDRLTRAASGGGTLAVGFREWVFGGT